MRGKVVIPNAEASDLYGMTQLLSLGLDGAAWHALDSLIAEGKLPTIERLAEEGTRGPLRSVHPPVTTPAWRASTSGKNPGKLGVSWWLDLDRSTGRFHSPNSDSFETADSWDYLNANGQTCAVLNVPMTYPPKPIDGLMVSGFGAPLGSGKGGAAITTPASFEPTLKERYDWQTGLDDVTAPGGVEAVYDLIDSRFDLLEDVLEDGYDYVHLTVFYINVLQHKFGDGPETEFAWQQIDARIGEFLDEVDQICLYSDHGHQTVEQTFAINSWLADQGYLQTASDGSVIDSLYDELYTVLETTGVSPRRLASAARTVLPKRVYDQVEPSGYSTAKLTDLVDWESSRAVATSQGPLYVNHDTADSSLEPRLQSELGSLTHDGNPVIDTVHRAEDLYAGAYVDQGPDLVLEPAAGWEIYGGLTPMVFGQQTTSWTSGNHPRGMVLFHGANVRQARLEERSILDIMPTILSCLDCPVPTDVDGAVIEDAFVEDLRPVDTRAPIDATPSNAQQPTADGDLKGRLEELGYLE